MDSKTWKCLEIHSKDFEQRNNLIQDILGLMRKLKKEKHVESYFFNRYSKPQENVFFIKFGFVNGDQTVQSQLDALLKTHSAIKDVQPYDCEMWEVDGVPIDKIKCVACEMYERITDNFKEKITIRQAFYLLHFLMNQVGFSYAEEHRLYKTLEENIKQQLEKS
jgi:hypothetical protein